MAAVRRLAVVSLSAGQLPRSVDMVDVNDRCRMSPERETCPDVIIFSASHASSPTAGVVSQAVMGNDTNVYAVVSSSAYVAGDSYRMRLSSCRLAPSFCRTLFSKVVRSSALVRKDATFAHIFLLVIEVIMFLRLSTC